MEMLKEPGNCNVEMQRIIVLMEGGHQWNAKRLGKLVVKCVDREEWMNIMGAEPIMKQQRCYSMLDLQMAFSE